MFADICITTRDFYPTLFSEAGRGDSQNVLVSKYGQGTVGDSDNQHWLYYDADDRRLSFQLEHKKISHIMMTLNTDD
ncbi:hypothetical protein [Pantoea anthophila]|uniref:hypothetical protein n=1 Tax=Pantoea anthophila TaxID=470931 RepID=UPI00128AE698|nr:hypothetical protein [Pantoea anthophila]